MFCLAYLVNVFIKVACFEKGYITLTTLILIPSEGFENHLWLRAWRGRDPSDVEHQRSTGHQERPERGADKKRHDWWRVQHGGSGRTGTIEWSQNMIQIKQNFVNIKTEELYRMYLYTFCPSMYLCGCGAVTVVFNPLLTWKNHRWQHTVTLEPIGEDNDTDQYLFAKYVLWHGVYLAPNVTLRELRQRSACEITYKITFDLTSLHMALVVL